MTTLERGGPRRAAINAELQQAQRWATRGSGTECLVGANQPNNNSTDGQAHAHAHTRARLAHLDPFGAAGAQRCDDAHHTDVAVMPAMLVRPPCPRHPGALREVPVLDTRQVAHVSGPTPRCCGEATLLRHRNPCVPHRIAGHVARWPHAQIHDGFRRAWVCRYVGSGVSSYVATSAISLSIL